MHHEKKSTDVRIISAWGPVSERIVAGGGEGGGINFYSSYTLTFFCTHVKENIQDNHNIFPDDDNGLANNKLE